MANKTSGIEETISVMLPICLTGPLETKAQFLGTLVSSMGLFLEKQRTTPLDEVRKALRFVFEEIANPDPEDNKNAYAREVFKQMFLEKPEVWYSDKYFPSVMLAKHLDQIAQARIFLSRFHEFYSGMKAGKPEGLNNSLKYSGYILEICQEIADFHGLYVVDQKGLVQSFAFFTQQKQESG